MLLLSLPLIVLGLRTALHVPHVLLIVHGAVVSSKVSPVTQAGVDVRHDSVYVCV